MKGEVVYVGFFSQGFDYISLLTNTNQIKKINMDLIKKLKKTPTTIMGITTAGPGAKIIKAIGYTKDAKIGALSAHGNILLFKSSDVRASGKTAGGVKCMTVDEKSGDRVVDIFPYTDEMFIFVHSETKGKMLSIEDLRIQKRGHE